MIEREYGDDLLINFMKLRRYFYDASITNRLLYGIRSPSLKDNYSSCAFTILLS